MKYLMIVLVLAVFVGCAMFCPPCKTVICDFDNKVMSVNGLIINR